MSESQSPMEQFNINELAGATGLILGAVGGILAIIFKSRCYCKFRIGCSDKYNLCMCERKPPPDNIELEDDNDDPSKPKPKPKETKPKETKPKETKPKEEEIFDEIIIPPTPKPRPAKKTNVELTIEEEMEIDPLKVLDSNRELTKEEKEKINSLV